MPLVALVDGVPALALDSEITRAVCRDPGCGAEMHRRAGRGFVPHWAHHAGTADRCKAEAGMTMWHSEWQIKCQAPDRIESVQGSRRADVLTRFGWAVEFQHSGMRGTDLRARENDWNGHLIWVQDGTAATAGAVTVHDAPLLLSEPFAEVTFDWIAPPPRIAEALCHQLVDIGGDRLLWLPGVPLPKNSADIIGRKGFLLTHETFAADWLNGDASTFPPAWGRSRWEYEQKTPRKLRAAPKPHSQKLRTALADAQDETDGYVCERAQTVAAEHSRALVGLLCDLCDDPVQTIFPSGPKCARHAVSHAVSHAVTVSPELAA